MSQRVDLSGLAPDDLTFNVSLTYQGVPLDLSTITTVDAYLKTTATAADTAGVHYGIGTGLTVVSSPNGQLTWFVPHTDTPGNGWYRFRITDAVGHVVTAVYGLFQLQDA